MAKFCIPFWFTLTLTLPSELISRCLYLENISYITNNFPQISLMLVQFLWGIHHVTTIFFVLSVDHFLFLLFAYKVL